MSNFALLIAGIALWYAAHLFKRIAPGARKSMGDAGQGIVALVLLASIVLMVLGYRDIDTRYLWYPPLWLRPVNYVLVLIALFMLSPASKKGALLNRVRHPMLIGFSLWAVAHLVVNGELAAVILFGGLGVWALVEIVVINHAEPDWRPGAKGTLAKDGLFFLASVVLLGVIGYVHGLIGPPAFVF